MTLKFRVIFLVLTIVAVFGLVAVSPSSHAGDETDVPDVVRKIAAAHKKGNKEQAKKLAADAVKKIDAMHDIMHMFQTRKKKGMGVGETPLANPAKDGIDVMLREYSREVPGGAVKQAEALEASGYWIAAIAELAIAKAPTKDAPGGKTKKAWIDWTEDMRVAGLAFAKAAAGKEPAAIKTAAAKAYSTCTSCHVVFKKME